MRGRARLWVFGVLMLSVIGAAETARADRIYFRDGTSVWGESAEELESEVTIFQGGRTLRFPKADVVKVERKRTNMPDYNVVVPPPPIAPDPSGVTVMPGGSSGGSGGTSSGSSGSGGRRY